MRSFILKKVLVLLNFLSVIIFLSGCIETQTCTIINKDGSCLEKVIVKAPNILTSDGIDSKLAQFEKNGYTYKIENTSSVQSITISKTHKNMKEMYSGEHFDPVANMLTSSKNSLSYSDLNLFFIRKINLKETIPKSSRNNTIEFNPVKSVVSNKRIIELPYSLSYSNADSIDSKTNTATWDITQERLETGFTFEAECFYINYTAIIIVFLIFLVIFLLIPKKKKSSI